MQNKMSPGTNIHSLAFTQISNKEVVSISSTYSVENSLLEGRILQTSLQTNKTRVINEQPGDYEHCQAISLQETGMVVYTAYQERQKAIFTILVKGNVVGAPVQLTQWGRFDSPSICEYQGKGYIFWENFTTGNSQIEYTIISQEGIALNSPAIHQVTESNERAYKPQVISDGKTLFLVYESFYEQRYHLMLRVLSQDEEKFSEAIEVGFDTLNDLSASLCISGEKVLLSWENSSPLDTDYVWKDHKGTIVTMPAFGHGWQVLCQMGLRALTYTDGELMIESLATAKGWNTPLALGNTESAGEPVVFQCEGIPLIAYLTKAKQAHYWQVVIKALESSEWREISIPEILYDYRQKPILQLLGNHLWIAGLKVDREERINHIFEISLDGELQWHHSSQWVTSKCIHMDKIFATSGFDDIQRESIEVGGEKFQLFWGDLHMHSNLSICSLHPKFHCTEVETKHRFSRDVGGLDFCLLTDHEVMDDYEWYQTAKYAHLHNHDEDFTCFAGFEWTSSMLKGFHNYGHYNVLFKDEGPLMRIKDGTFETVEKVCHQIERTPGLIIPHHPGEKVHPLDWDAFPTHHSPLVEIFQVRGSYEYDGCEMHPENYGRGVQPNNSIQTGLNMGYRFGFTSGGEHEGVGITGVYARELSREAIYDALEKRQVYGTTHPRIFLDFRVNGSLMGSEITLQAGESLQFTAEVKGTSGIEEVSLVSSLGEMLLYQSPESTACKLSWKEDFLQQTNWYYLRLKQTDGNMAWSSPVWVDRS